MSDFNAGDRVNTPAGVTAAFRLLAEAAEALDARSFHILDAIEHDLTWREHEGHPMRQVDRLLLGMAKSRTRAAVAA